MRRLKNVMRVPRLYELYRKKMEEANLQENLEIYEKKIFSEQLSD